MTRFLSDALQAPEPFFSAGLRRLEKANGAPSTDIRLTSDTEQAAKAKIRELGLDPKDTSLQQLYLVLQEKLALDDVKLVKTLRTLAATKVNAEADVVAGMVHALNQLNETKRSFAIKNSRLKTILKAVPPKKAMKHLGYRSLDSCLKHESPILVIAAAYLTESSSWYKSLIDQYKKLTAYDFEDRQIQLLHPVSKHWHELATQTVETERHNIMAFRELGALIFLPLPSNLPPGVVTASLSLGLHELNQIRSSSSFLKLNRMQANFSLAVVKVMAGDPQLSSTLLDQPVPWNLIQHYFARLNQFREDLFEPHLEPADLVWQPVEDALSLIEPAFSFWRNTSSLGLVNDHQPLSFNVIDTAINCCNHLPFESRMVHYFQQSLWYELLLKYLHHQPVEHSVLEGLQPRLAPEMVVATS